jgi:tryptophan-rich sensory protein
MLQSLPSLLAWILGTCVAAVSGAVTARAAGEFYASLDRPRWAPPAWLFGPAWSVLYVTMGIAAWRVWHAHGFDGARTALLLYVVQLAFNASWSWFFFVKRTGIGATIDVLLLWSAIVATLVAFARLDTIAALLFVPYLIWVTFATALTISVWRRNPALL